MPLQERAVTSLKSLQAMLDQIKLKEEAEKHDTMVDAVKQAKEKLAKLEALNQKMKEAMEQVRGQKNKDDKATDEMEEAFKELQKNTKEALLEVPTDLHIFTDLNVANDLVEDVFSVFQEIEQGRARRRRRRTKWPSSASPRKTSCWRRWARLRSGSMPWRCGWATSRTI